MQKLSKMAKNEEKLVIYSPLLMEESLTCRKYTNPKRYLGSKAIEPGHFRLYSLEKKYHEQYVKKWKLKYCYYKLYIPVDPIIRI